MGGWKLHNELGLRGEVFEDMHLCWLKTVVECQQDFFAIYDYTEPEHIVDGHSNQRCWATQY